MAESTLRDIVSALEDDIVFGQLKPREHLTEDTLMTRFGAKRYIVRRALDELERMGIVVRLPYRGARVRDFSVSEIQEVYDFREKLQQWAAELIPLPADPKLIERLSDLYDRHVAALEEGRLRAVNEINTEFHETIYRASGNRFLAETILHLMWVTAAMRSYPMTDRRMMGTICQEHRDIIDAVAAGDRKRLVRLCVGHTRHSKKTYLDLLRRLGPVDEGAT